MKGRRQMKVAMEIAGFAPTPRNEPKLGLQLRDLGEMMPCVQVGHTPPHSSAGWPADADLHRVRRIQVVTLRALMCAHKRLRRRTLRSINNHRGTRVMHSTGAGHEKLQT